ncbi:helix-turn-helix domain-containing protein [Micromonospora sp. CPCC 206171]|uniref:helix-turn-helix domain-containing protein n=1 Tax=Micromonospora sp. CPCC 206171 TaxID=3122405 RepID=UPI003FA5EB83
MNTWVRRYHAYGLAGLADRPRPGKPAVVPGPVRARILALTRTTPPEVTGLSHWSSREMASHLARHEDIRVSHNFVADLPVRRIRRALPPPGPGPAATGGRCRGRVPRAPARARRSPPPRPGRW